MKKLVPVLLAALGLLLAAPAAAHEGEASFTDVAVDAAGDGQVTVTVHLAYEQDGHGVPDATITAVVEGATPVTLQPGGDEGTYTGTLAAPPGAQVRITSVDPAATAEAVAPEASGGTTTAPEATTTTAAAPSSTIVAPSTTAPSSEAGDDDDGISPLVLGGIVVVVAAVGMTAAVVLRRTREV
jgi:cobalamin biosynthesis Mg chelatase CobN